MNSEKIKCPICESEKGVYLCHKGTRDNASIDVYGCNECGTRFLSKLDVYNDYENGFMYETNNLSQLDINERLTLYKDDDVRRVEMIKNLCTNKKVLDFGCGYGGFLQNISEIAYSCKGVEVGKSERQYVNSKGIICLKTLDEFDEKFDVITLFHVFEHLPNPKMWLKELNAHLTQGGYLVIEVPNANDALISLYENQQFADFTYWSAHLFLYTVKSLTMVIEGTNLFDIVSAGQIQRYSIANHLMWLAKGVPGGHNKWKFLDTNELNAAYTNSLMKLQMCDTLFFILKKR